MTLSDYRSLGNGVPKNEVRNRCPYRRCGVDTEIPYLGCTPRGGGTATQRSEKGSEKVLGRVLGKGVLRRVLRKGSAVGFTVKKSSEKGSQKGF